jgi:hypothetical protein
MTNKIFSGTTVAWSLLGESSPGSGFSAIWRHPGEAGGAIASVDSGNNAFWVSGLCINQTFEKSFGSSVAAFFMPVHSAAVKAAQAGTPVTTNFVAPQPVQLVSVHLPDGQGPSAAFPDETVFLDILTAAARPHGDPSNAAMIYAVPPDGRTAYYASDALWLDSIGRTAANAVAVLADYNAVQVAAHPTLLLSPIPVLRMCSLGGKIFRRAGVATSDLANAIFAGVADALTALTKAGTAHGITLVEFENGDHGFDALK